MFKKEHIEEIYNERLEICKGCEFIDKTGEKCAMPNTQPCCGKCGCSLKFKLRSLSSDCPVDKWKAVLTEDEEDKLNKTLDNNQ
jgi:hypothetical protein